MSTTFFAENQTVFQLWLYLGNGRGSWQARISIGAVRAQRQEQRKGETRIADIRGLEGARFLHWPRGNPATPFLFTLRPSAYAMRFLTQMTNSGDADETMIDWCSEPLLFWQHTRYMMIQRKLIASEVYHVSGCVTCKLSFSTAGGVKTYL